LDPNVIFDANKIPIEYDCEAQLADISSIGPMSETTVSVDYEALIPASADAATNARSLQWRILLAAVEDAGLDRCNMETQRYQATPQVDTLGVNTTLYAIRNDLKSSSTFNTCKFVQGGDKDNIGVEPCADKIYRRWLMTPPSLRYSLHLFDARPLNSVFTNSDGLVAQIPRARGRRLLSSGLCP